jgi:hypothetical protein
MHASEARALGAALIAAADKADAAGESDISLQDVLSHATHAKVDSVQALADQLRQQQAAGTTST